MYILRSETVTAMTGLLLLELLLRAYKRKNVNATIAVGKLLYTNQNR